MVLIDSAVKWRAADFSNTKGVSAICNITLNWGDIHNVLNAQLYGDGYQITLNGGSFSGKVDTFARAGLFASIGSEGLISGVRVKVAGNLQVTDTRNHTYAGVIAGQNSGTISLVSVIGGALMPTGKTSATEN